MFHGHYFTDGNTEIIQDGTTARTTRTLKVVRLVRMVRLVKISKFFFKTDEDEEDIKNIEKEASKIGTILQDRTMQKVITVILLMVFFLPLLQAGGLDNLAINAYQQHGLENLHRLPQDLNLTGGISVKHFKNAFQEYADFSGLFLFCFSSFLRQTHCTQ